MLLSAPTSVTAGLPEEAARCTAGFGLALPIAVERAPNIRPAEPPDDRQEDGSFSVAREGAPGGAAADKPGTTGREFPDER
jgi:hypothetical protein